MNAVLEKRCSRCGDTKPASDFQKRKASKDGLTAACKQCLAGYDKSRANLPHRVKARQEYAKTPEGQIAGERAKRKWIQKNPLKRQAHIIVGNALRDGKLTRKPCEECGNPKVHAHHDDYAQPLEVRWLCDRCHNDWHAANGEGKNANGLQV